MVTASHAIFVEKGGYKAPAAVVGLQYRNSAFRETFFNITSGVIDLLSQGTSKQHSDMPLCLYSAPAESNVDERAAPVTYPATLSIITAMS